MEDTERGTEEREPGQDELQLAAFSERIVAFTLDLALFAACYYASLALVFRKYSVFLNPYSGQWALMWAGFFLVYQGFLSCEGRRSLGKAALGIRVVDRDGAPLGVGAAALRSLLYVVSSILNLGFLWSLFNPARRCWHDLAVGSLVVRDAPRESGGAHPLVRLAAAGCAAVFLGAAAWKHVVGPRYYANMDVAYARVGLQEIARLQAIHHSRFGVYAKDLLALAPLSGAPEDFLRDMANLFDLDAGVRIEASARGYTVTARAADEARTLLVQKGP